MFLVLRIAPKSRAKVCAQWRILKPPGSLLATDRSKAVVLVLFLLIVFGVGVLCRNLYSFVVNLYVNGSGSITSVVEEKANLSAVVCRWLCGFCYVCLFFLFFFWLLFFWGEGFLFLWVLGMGYVILLWHSLSLPYNYFVLYNLFCFIELRDKA